MQHKSYRKTELIGLIVDFVSIDVMDGQGNELGILTVQVESGEIRCGYGCGDSLRNALSLFYPDGWRGQSIAITLESHSIVMLERRP